MWRPLIDKRGSSQAINAILKKNQKEKAMNA